MKRIPVLAMLTALVALWTIAVLVPSEAEAAVPRLINFQGVVKDSAGGTPLVDQLGITFTIYDAPLGGSALWTESHLVTMVAGGLFNVLLGEFNPIPDSVFEDTVRYVGIQVESDPEMLPRQRLTSAGYAFRVGTVDGATGGVISGDVSIQSNLAVDGAMDAKNLVLINPGPVQTPISIQGSSGQTANLLNIMDGAGSPLVTVGPGGAMNAKNMVLVNPGPTSTPLSIQGSSGQTANLMEIKDGGGSPLITVGASGAMNAKNLVLNGPGPVQTPLSIQGSSGQSANLMEVKSGSGGTLAGIGSDGSIFLADASGAPGAVLQATGGSGGSGRLGAGGGGGGGAIKVESPTDGGRVILDPGTTAGKVVIEGEVGQTANLLECNLPLPGGGLSTAMKIGPNGDVTTGPLQVDGSIALNLTTVTQTDCGLTLDKFQSIIIVDFATTGTDTVCTINLPTAVGIKGRKYTIKRARSVTTPQVVIDPYLNETIDNGLLMTLATPGNYATIVSDGANWQTIAFGNSP